MIRKSGTILEFLEDGLDALLEACNDNSQKLEIDIKDTDPPKLLALAACLASYALHHFDDRKLAKKMFDDLMTILAKTDHWPTNEKNDHH
jgi:hypothetical protein